MSKGCESMSVTSLHEYFRISWCNLKQNVPFYFQGIQTEIEDESCPKLICCFNVDCKINWMKLNLIHDEYKQSRKGEKFRKF